MELEPYHYSVLLKESIDALNIRPDGIYVDGTLGLGGHSEQIAKRLTTGRLIAIDRDQTALERAGERLAPYAGRITFVHGNFRALPRLLAECGAEKADGRTWRCGYTGPGLYAGFPHLHFGGETPLAERFVKACEEWKTSTT